MRPLGIIRQFRRCLATQQRVLGDPSRTQGLEFADKVIDKANHDFNIDLNENYPSECDVLVIGGGAIGCSVGYWLTKHVGNRVVVLERDTGYTRAATPLSVGGIRQQFSEPENIQLSLFGAHFLSNIKENLAVLDLDPPDINFTHQGYLVLADQARAEGLQRNHALQRQLGAKIDLMTADRIQNKWPWINVSDVELGAYGTENEGWFDPYLLLQALRRKALSQSVQFAVGDLLDFEFSLEMINVGDHVVEKKVLRSAMVKTPDNLLRKIDFGIVVNAAGPWAAEVAALAGVGDFAGEHKLPVQPRKQSTYVVSLPPSAANRQQQQQQQQQQEQLRLPSIDAPFIQDFAGLHLKREGFHGDFVAYVQQQAIMESSVANLEPECNGEDLEVNYDWFDTEVWPRLAHRVPCMEAAKVRNAWAGFYDYNSFDQNLIIGQHPYHDNLVFCNGSSGHGIQHAVGIGRAVTELILFGRYKTIDLSRMSFLRLVANEPIKETGII